VSFRGRIGSGFSTILFFLIVAAVLVLSGCGGGGGGTSVQPPPSSESVTVSVQDAFTRSPLSSASVQIGSQTLTTNNSGIASFSNLNPGVYTLTVSKSGYQSFSLKVPCNKGMQFQVRLTPNLTSPVTDQTFHQASLNVLGAARGLQEAFALMNSSPDPTKQDPFVFFISASKAFSSAVDNLKTYTPSKGTRSVLDILSTLGSLLKIGQGADQIKQTNEKLNNGQDVPEIDAYLANNPYQGAHSLAELKQQAIDNGGQLAWELKYAPNVQLLYEIKSPDSGFNKVWEGAKDIFISQFTQVGEIFTNLIGWTVDKVWSGTKDVVINTINYGQLILNNTDQIAWLWEKGKQKLLIGEVKKDTPMTLPQGTMDILVSNGYAHKPTIQDSIPITGAGTQTIDITAEPINVTPPSGGETYVGRYSGYLIDSNPVTSWKHSLDIDFTVTVIKDAYGRVTCTGTFNGNWIIKVISTSVPLDPPYEGTVPIQNVKGQYDGYYPSFGCIVSTVIIEPNIYYDLWLGDGVINNNSANATLYFYGVFNNTGCRFKIPVTLTLQKARKR
jgi:hypothetical protein